MEYVNKIQAGIKKQQDLWKQFNKTKPTEDMAPGEKQRRTRRCNEIYQEIEQTRQEVQELDRQWKEERTRAIGNLSPGQRNTTHANKT